MSKSQQFDKIVIGSETTFGTIASSFSTFAKVQSGSLVSSQEFNEDVGVGEGLNNTNAYWGNYSCNGSLSTNLTSFDLLEYWVGPKTGSGTAGTPYVLTEHDGFGTTSSKLKPFSIKVGNSDGTADVWKQTGCYGTDFSISADINGKVSFSGNWVGQKTLYKAESLS